MGSIPTLTFAQWESNAGNRPFIVFINQDRDPFVAFVVYLDVFERVAVQVEAL